MSSEMSLGDLRADFPVFADGDPERPLAYLDSAASSQMPRQVIEAMVNFQSHSYANIHRGLYRLSGASTAAYDSARQTVASFIGASDRNEVIFTSGATASLNFLAYSWGEKNIQAGDEIALPLSEHHANLVPWQQLALRKGAKLRWIELTPEGTIDWASLQEALSHRPKLLTFAWVSNVFGTVHPVAKIAKLAHEAGATVVLDGSQGVPHLECDVQRLGVDFLAFSGHKMLGPTGIGVLWGRMSCLEELPPFLYGGDMISIVKRERSSWAEIPNRFEAGTPNITGAVGLSAACAYLSRIGFADIRSHDLMLMEYAIRRLEEAGATVLGPKDLQQRSGVLSFRYKKLHPHDIATILGRDEVCVRAGHHCCQPLMREIGMTGTTRASFYVYNTRADIDRLAESLAKVGDIFHIAPCPCTKIGHKPAPLASDAAPCTQEESCGECSCKLLNQSH
ncbi:SufS family cysteine desulfurase [bacterium]|nr:SufS family cysteine desulfurase [bacterium]